MRRWIGLLVIFIMINLGWAWVSVTAFQPVRSINGDFIVVTGKGSYRGSYSWADHAYIDVIITVYGYDSGIYKSSTNERTGVINGTSFLGFISTSVSTFQPYGKWCTKIQITCEWYGTGVHPDFTTGNIQDLWVFIENDDDTACVFW